MRRKALYPLRSRSLATNHIKKEGGQKQKLVLTLYTYRFLKAPHPNNRAMNKARSTNKSVDRSKGVWLSADGDGGEGIGSVLSVLSEGRASRLLSSVLGEAKPGAVPSSCVVVSEAEGWDDEGSDGETDEGDDVGDDVSNGDADDGDAALLLVTCQAR